MKSCLCAKQISWRSRVGWAKRQRAHHQDARSTIDGGHVARAPLPTTSTLAYTASLPALQLRRVRSTFPWGGISEAVYRIGTVGRSRSLSGCHREGQPGGGLASSSAPVAVAEPVADGAGTRAWRRTRETHHAAIGTDRGRARVLRAHQAGGCGDHRSAGRGSQSARRNYRSVESRCADSVCVILCRADRQPFSKILSQRGRRTPGFR